MRKLLLFAALFLAAITQAQNTSITVVGGELRIIQISDFNSPQNFQLTQDGTNLNILNTFGGGFQTGTGVVEVDSQNAQVPMALITNGLFIDGISVPDPTNTLDFVLIDVDFNFTTGDVVVQNAARIQQWGTINTTSGNFSYSAERDIIIGYTPQRQGQIITESGTITLNGNQQATPTSSVNDGTLTGVRIEKLARLQSISGNIILNGRGGDAGNSHHGIHLSLGGSIQTTGTGNITLNGTSTLGSNSFCRGIYIESQASTNEQSTISVVDGNISILGTSNGKENSEGVWLDGNITSTGTGTIAIEGTGGVGVNGNSGVVLNGYEISSATGNILITGNGGGNGNGDNNRGIDFIQGTVSSVGNATITLNGNAGLGINDNYGIRLRGGSFINTINSTININGTANTNATGIANYGVYTDANPQVISTGNAAINITAIGTNTAEDIFTTAVGAGGLVGGANASGDITLNANTISFADPATGNPVDVRFQSSGTLFIIPRTNNTTIGLGDSATGILNLTSEELNTFLDGFALISIGNTNSGDIDSNPHLYSDPLILSGANISIEELDTGNNEVTFISSTGNTIQESDVGPHITANTAFIDGNLSVSGSNVGTQEIMGNLSFQNNSELTVNINGETDFDQLQLTGTPTLTLNDATLSASIGNGFSPDAEEILLIDIAGTNPVAGTFNGLAEGNTFMINGFNFTITYVGGDGNDVVLNAEDVLSTNDFLLKSLRVYPNPANELINISNPNNINIQTLQLFDLRGRLIKSWNQESNNTQLPLSLQGVSSGTYLLSIRSDQGRAVKRVIKK